MNTIEKLNKIQELLSSIGNTPLYRITKENTKAILCYEDCPNTLLGKMPIYHYRYKVEEIRLFNDIGIKLGKLVPQSRENFTNIVCGAKIYENKEEAEKECKRMNDIRDEMTLEERLDELSKNHPGIHIILKDSDIKRTVM